MKKILDSLTTNYHFIVVVLFVMCGIYLLLTSVQVDVLWRIHVVETLLNGEELYIASFDPNAPMITFIYIIPVTLAKFINVDSYIVVKVFALVIAASVLFISTRLLAKLTYLSDSLRKLLLVFLTLLLTVGVGENLAQKEYFLVLLFIPYFISTLRYLDNVPVKPLYALIFGLVAGIAFAIKPFFIVIPLLLELAVMIINKRFHLRTELIGIILTQLLYIIAAVAFAPKYFSSLEVIVYGYSQYYRISYEWFIVEGFIPFVLTVLAIVCAIRHKKLRPPLTASAVVTATLISIALLQNKAYPYHLYPANVFALSFILILIIGIFQKTKAAVVSNGKFIFISLIIFITLGIYLHSKVYLNEYVRFLFLEDPVRMSREELVFAHNPENKSVLFLTTRFDNAVNFHYWTNTPYGTRYPSLWLLPAVLQPNNTPRDSLIEAYFYDSLEIDLTSRRPEFILVEKNDPVFEYFRIDTPETIYEYFSEHSKLAPILNQYVLQYDDSNTSLYRLEN